jgi:hypothetical protein
MFDQWGCACYISVYKLGWLVYIVQLKVFVNIVRFMMRVCAGGSGILTYTRVECLVGVHMCRSSNIGCDVRTSVGVLFMEAGVDYKGHF